MDAVPHPTSPQLTPNTTCRMLVSFFVFLPETLLSKRIWQMYRGKARSEADNAWRESNTPFLHPPVQRFWDGFHIVSQKVPARLCPVAHKARLNYWLLHLSCLNIPLSGLPFTLTTFMQILESGSAFIVTHTKVLRNNFLWEPWGNNLHFCRIVWAWRHNWAY